MPGDTEQRGGSRPGIVAGALIGGALSAALAAIFYAAWRAAGLPFVPFDVFDWTARALPGGLVTFGIDTIVAVIRLVNLGPTAETAKTVEQVLAVAGLPVIGGVAGAILFAVLGATGGRHVPSLGSVAGAALGVPAALMSSSSGQTATAGPVARAAWIVAAFLAWGAAAGWSYMKLALAGAAEDADVARLDRRRFLVRLGGATAVVTVSGAVVGELLAGRRRREVERGERWSASHELPNSDASVGPAPGTRPEFTPLEAHYRIDINTIVPSVTEESWRLRVVGLVDAPVDLTLDDLRSRYEPLHQFITLSCISNPIAGDLIGTTRWTGVSLQQLLPGWRLRQEATHLKITSADGFYEIVPLETIRADERVMLTYAWDGVPLPRQHGFPLRIYIPDVYGMKQPKWIESIEAIDRWEPGYWVERGWDREARMNATSVIDTVAVDMTIAQPGGLPLVPVGGIAHAGSRGISRVEVQVDEGEWREAELRTPLSGLTWVVWRYDWPFQEGRHTFRVRCHDGNGVQQVMEDRSVRPSGATGVHARSARL